MFPWIPRVLLMLATLLPLVGCGDDTPDTPTQPTPPTVTDTFSGTLNANSGRTHQFAAAASGDVTATLTSLAPDSALRIGVSLGTWNGAACQIIVANDNATQSSQVVGRITTVGGSFCVRLYDVGNITQSISYEVQVVHP